VQQFRAAIEAQDIEAAIALLSDDVVFHSPIAFTPYRGRAGAGRGDEGETRQRMILEGAPPV
jgi:ketosteroid isomerase-like protein